MRSTEVHRRLIAAGWVRDDTEKHHAVYRRGDEVMRIHRGGRAHSMEATKVRAATRTRSR